MGGQRRSVKCTEGVEREKQGKERLWDMADKREVREAGAVTITSHDYTYLHALYIATFEAFEGFKILSHVFIARSHAILQPWSCGFFITFCEAPQTMSRPDQLSHICNQ